MEITKNTIVKIDYTLKDKDDKVVDTSYGQEPLEYIHGQKHLLPGLEKALDGKTAGDKFHVEIDPQDAYGDYDENLVADVPRSQFPEDVEITVGMQFQTDDEVGTHFVTVKAIDEENVTVDANFPLAGQKLFFDVEVKEVREATAEEIKIAESANGSSCSSECCDGCSGCK